MVSFLLTLCNPGRTITLSRRWCCYAGCSHRNRSSGPRSGSIRRRPLSSRLQTACRRRVFLFEEGIIRGVISSALVTSWPSSGTALKLNSEWQDTRLVPWWWTRQSSGKMFHCPYCWAGTRKEGHRISKEHSDRDGAESPRSTGCTRCVTWCASFTLVHACTWQGSRSCPRVVTHEFRALAAGPVSSSRSVHASSCVQVYCAR